LVCANDGLEESAQAAVLVRQVESLAALHEGVVEGRRVDSARQERIEVAVVEKRHQEDQKVVIRLVEGRAEVGQGTEGPPGGNGRAPGIENPGG